MAVLNLKIKRLVQRKTGIQQPKKQTAKHRYTVVLLNRNLNQCPVKYKMTPMAYTNFVHDPIAIGLHESVNNTVLISNPIAIGSLSIISNKINVRQFMVNTALI